VLNPKEKIDSTAIIGEGFLGEPIRRNKEQALSDAKVLASFYEEAITNLGKMLKPGGRIVLAIPFFIIKNEFIYLPIQGLNLKKINPVEKFGIKLPGRGNLTYFRKDQFVGREILILEK
jgi:tRNA G10  N-methylase Trm11